MTSILTLTPEIHINTQTAGFQTAPVVATLADGTYIVAWVDSVFDGDIVFQHYSASGVRLGNARIADASSISVSSPAITALADGGFVIAWSGNGGAGDTSGIFFQRFDGNGVASGTQARANAYTTNTQNDPSIAGLAGGGFVISWTSAGQDGDSTGIYATTFSQNGNWLGVDTLVSVTTTSAQQYSAIAALADGTWVATWASLNQDGSGYGVYQRHFSETNAPLSGETLVNTTTNSVQTNPAIATLADGSYVITWSGAGAHDGSGIVAMQFAADGTPLTPELRVNTTTADVQGNPTVTALDDGGFVIAWASLVQDGSGYGVYQQRFDHDGHAVGSETLLNVRTPYDQKDVSISGLAGGGYVAVWSSDGQEDSLTGIYGRVFRDATGLNGTQYLYGTHDADMLDGGSGADVMAGGLGNDVYYVNSYQDQVVEGLFGGIDLVMSSAGEIALADNVENLTLIGAAIDGLGNALDNVMTGNSGNNVLSGDTGQDVLTGAEGNDQLFGGDDDDTLDGGTGNDQIWGDQGINTVNGGDGDDIIHTTQTVPRQARQAGNAGDTFNWVSGGHGNDTFDASNSDRVDINLVTGKAYSQGVRIAQLAEIENLVGSQYDDRLIGDGGFNQLYGGFGNDILDGNAGDDDLYGEDGNDTASYLSAGSGVTVSLLLNGQDQDTIGNGTDYLDSIENLTGSRFNDVLTGDANGNVIDGSAGADRLTGGVGNDTYWVDSVGDVVVEIGGQGTDRVNSSVTYVLTPTLENLTLMGTAAINGTGNNAVNIITGNSGNNRLDGGLGGDTLNGGAGADTIRGNAGSDFLTGGADADIFVFEKFGIPTNGVDRIMDFTSGVDKLSFTAADYGFSVGQVLNATQFHTGISVGTNGQFLYSTVNRFLLWDPDGTGATAGIPIAVFDDLAQPVTTDFVFT